MGFHLLAPSKEQDTGDVIAKLTAGEEVGETGEKISEHEACAERGVLKLEWLLGYCISVQPVILLKCVYSCQLCFFTCRQRKFQHNDLAVSP